MPTVADRTEACIVNHNSSSFTELALRSLIAKHTQLVGSGQLAVTVIDNHSTDDGLAELTSACAELGAAYELSSWPADETKVNSHGDVLREFVAARPTATNYLFVDADTYCITDATVDKMIIELESTDDVWAVQARFSWIEEHEGAGRSFDLWTGRVQQLRFEIDHALGGPFPGEHKQRCHPAFALVRNSQVFRRVADVIGLSAALVIAADQTVAGFADTFGLATLVMKTHGLHHVLSDVTVGHYHGVTYQDPNQPIGGKLDDCLARLDELRSDK